MRASILFATAAALAVSACASSDAQDAGPEIGRNFAVGGFDRIEVAGPYEVQVTTGGQPSVSARGPSSIVEKMVVEVDGSTLKIHPEKRSGMFGSWSNSKGIARVAVSVPMIGAAEIAGSGGMTVNHVAGERFAGTIAGSGDLRLADVQVRQLGLEIAGSGGVQASGRAANATYEIAGSGSIEAGRVLTENARAEIAGSGNITAHASQTARAEIAGSGNVRVSGGAKCSVSKAGSGNVSCS